MSDFKPYLKKEPEEKPLFRPRKRLTKRPRITGELQLFRQIAVKQGLRSQISGTRIQEPTVSNMMHVLAKGQNKYPKFKLYEPNIWLVTEEEHDQWDKGLREDLKKDPRWNKVFQAEEKLKQEYKELE